MDSLGFKIAIPSYKRSKTIGEKTLQYLQDCQIDMAKVYIFVADAIEYEDYKHYIDDLGLNIVIGVPTLCGQRNFITNYFEEGDYILNMDDDLEGIYIKIDDKKYEKTFDLNVICNEGFTLCKTHYTKLWGIGAVLNALFMNLSSSMNLKYIVGCFWGYIIDKRPTLTITLEDKEDFERTILYYQEFGTVARLNRFAPKTNYYKEQGGMQETRTAQRVTDSAYYLAHKYPQYCKINTSKKSENTEVRLFHDKSFNKQQTSLF